MTARFARFTLDDLTIDDERSFRAANDPVAIALVLSGSDTTPSSFASAIRTVGP